MQKRTLRCTPLRLSRSSGTAATTSSGSGDDLSSSQSLLSQKLLSVRRSPAYLRRAPPHEYYTTSTSESASLFERHRLRVIDDNAWRRQTQQRRTAGVDARSLEAAAAAIHTNSSRCPPAADVPTGFSHCSGSFLLTSAEAEDVRFASPHLTHSLIGLPDAHGEEEVEQFVQHLKVQCGAASPSLRAVYLPEVFLSTPLLVRRLIAEWDASLSIICSEGGREMILNDHLWKELGRWLRRDDMTTSATLPPLPPSHCLHAVPTRLAEANKPSESCCTFQFMTPSAGELTGDGAHCGDRTLVRSTVTGCNQQEVVHGGQCMLALPVVAEAGVSHGSGSPSLTFPSIFYYSTACQSVFVGRAILRLPWLQPFVFPPSQSTAAAPPLLPLPTPLCLDGTQPHSSRGPRVVAPWDVAASTQAITATLRRLVSHAPTASGSPRILTALYGEVGGSGSSVWGGSEVDDVVASLEASAAKLVSLRSHLTHALRKGREGGAAASSTHDSQLKQRLQTRVLTEVLLQDLPKGGDGNGSAELQQLQNEFLLWAGEHYAPWSRLIDCLYEAAHTLPPVKPSPAGKAVTAAGDGVTGRPQKSKGGGREGGLPEEMTGSQGAELLLAILSSKGLSGDHLARRIRSEDIDVEVFLGMSRDELQEQFKPTFGLLKRLLRIQDEVQRTTQEVLKK